MDEITKLREQRAKIIEDQRKMLDKAEKEKRDLTSEETEQYEKMEADFDDLTKQIEEAEKREQERIERAKKLEEREELLKKSQQEPTKPEVEDRKKDHETRKIEYEMAAFRSFLLNGAKGLTPVEERALQADIDATGGFLVAPEQFTKQLIQKLDDTVFVRQYANIIKVANAVSLGAPALDNDPGDPTWTAEIKTGSEDSTMDFDKRTLNPHPLARRIKVSKKLLRVALLDVDAIVRERLAYKFAVVEENAFLNGSGSNQPLGVFTASAHGINTSRDVSTDNTTTQIKADNLINCKYTLKAQYRKKAIWVFHRDGIKMIRKLKDGNGDYLWKQGIAAGKPDTILDLPYIESEYAPNTFTTGKYVGILGDFSFYWIADALNMQIQVLTELYAETGQNGYIARKETDGMPVLEEAFVRVKLA
jgi:HK97 family phage major capsid protein